MINPNLIEIIANAQQSDRLHEAESQRLLKSLGNQRIKAHKSRLILALSGATLVAMFLVTQMG